jgi:hypothetical protein
MSEALIGTLQVAKWMGERPSVERVEVMPTRRPGLQGAGSLLLPKYGRQQTIETVTHSTEASSATTLAAIRAMEGTTQTIQWNGINYSSSLSTVHLVQAVEIIAQRLLARAIGKTYAGTAYDYEPAVEIVCRWTLIPVAA